MADSVELRMSVTSIKRVDPYVKDILATSTHVALYKFNPIISEWERTETEGALFLYSRSGEPWHSVMIMNRLNTNNLIEPIVKEFEYQMQPPFLLYRNSRNKIYGIWFYNREECIQITYLLESLMEGLKEKLIEKTKSREMGVDIFSMLSKAQEDFNNKTPTKSEMLSQPQYSSTPRSVDMPSQSVMDFFAKASTKPVKPAVVTQGESENLLQKLMSNPAHSVEHIEKQQRSVTPQDRKNLPVFFPSNNISLDKDHEPHNGLSFIGGASPAHQQVSPLASLLAHNLTMDETERRCSPLIHFDTPQKPQLMPPMMFATSTSKEKSEYSQPDKEVDLLTSNQLVQALIHLLKNDTDFVAKVHEAYTKSVNEKLNCANGNLFK
ncbi:hypothetical protein PPYR_11517 [Photinus pyralis]|uniref:mRNA-decapping enzyme C-terminal domain-containing protein n=1 Tax=Photinus pyralis TaxID=7054 RepID=A0A1Y1NJX3_PHOPY|nr:mRNA-decapping enzyme 1B [Photinus pyralis]KAB0794678.1 hypothetical protein PPYR_11517 [Photinus pyralis]